MLISFPNCSNSGNNSIVKGVFSTEALRQRLLGPSCRRQVETRSEIKSTSQLAKFFVRCQHAHSHRASRLAQFHGKRCRDVANRTPCLQFRSVSVSVCSDVSKQFTSHIRSQHAVQLPSLVGGILITCDKIACNCAAISGEMPIEQRVSVIIGTNQSISTT